jgi:hypothetical protein
MKSILLSIITTVVLFTTSTIHTHAQGQIFDVVSINPGYTNQSFYSMANGEVSNVSNLNWDLAFQIAGWQATILVNGKNNVRLFRSGQDVNSWSSITANDTIGVLNSSNELFNQDTSWWSGAFNITNDASNPFDLGWGVYDFVTHTVLGDSLYFIKLSNGTVKKLWIQSLQNSIYNFAYADVDGSNEVNAQLNKMNFPGKNFVYYSIANGASLDREPNKYLWDLTFMQYMSTIPLTYKVTGVLANDSVTVAKVYPVDVATATPWGANYSKYINTIGYNWKNYDFNTNSWLIEDSTVFFINSRPGGLWKMVFTAFGGSANGNYEFYKEQVSATGLNENGGKPALLNLYPNPAHDRLQLTLFTAMPNPDNRIELFDVTGKEQSVIALDGQGLQTISVPLTSLAPGVYVVRVVVEGIASTQRFIVSR